MVANFREKNYSAEHRIDGNFDSFDRNSVCFAERKALRIPFQAIPWKKKNLGIPLRIISRKIKKLGIPFQTIHGTKKNTLRLLKYTVFSSKFAIAW